MWKEWGARGTFYSPTFASTRGEYWEVGLQSGSPAVAGPSAGSRGARTSAGKTSRPRVALRLTCLGFGYAGRVAGERRFGLAVHELLLLCFAGSGRRQCLADLHTPREVVAWALC